MTDHLPNAPGGQGFYNMEAFRHLVETLPFGHAERPPVFRAPDIVYALHHNGLVSGEGVIEYPDYYGCKTVSFRTNNTIPRNIPEHLIPVPRDQWRQWNIVLSGADVYAERERTGMLRKDAEAHPAHTFIGTLIEELQDTLPPAEVSERLHKLGRIPLSPYVGVRAVQTIQARAIRSLRVEESVVDWRPAESSQDSYVVVHTPRQSVEPSLYAEPQALLAAQKEGRVESVRFNIDGSYAPEGSTRAFTYDRTRIPEVQARFLRRVAYIATQTAPSPSPKQPPGLSLMDRIRQLFNQE